MKQIYPSYYPNFQCIAGACTDSCCIGWEIGIDEETLEKYHSFSGALGEQVRRGLEEKEGAAYFRLKNGRCPMLTGENLCRLILEEGEGVLCEICREHPRFHNRFGEKKESGLGLCCEAAARLILEEKSPLSLLESEIDEENDNAFSLSPCFDVLKRARNAIFTLLRKDTELKNVLGILSAMAQDLQEGLMMSDEEKLRRVVLQYDNIQNPEDFCVGLGQALGVDEQEKEAVWRGILDFFLTLTPLDYGWHERLRRVRRALPKLLENRREFLRENFSMDKEQRRIAEYFIYRYFLQAEFDGDLLSKVSLTVVSCLMIGLLEQEKKSESGKLGIEERVECVKAYSKEIEYSQENMESLAEGFWTESCFSLPALLAVL